ncbi:hypothetical protein CJ177_44625 [Rhodococcus sp. ACPA1]|nr:hypothetical protein CJ177_44625 [Rhodococcus sp. ACPA1]
MEKFTGKGHTGIAGSATSGPGPACATRVEALLCRHRDPAIHRCPVVWTEAPRNGSQSVMMR